MNQEEISNNNHIYIFKSFGEDGRYIYKLGYSINTESRLNDYKALNPFIKAIATFNNAYPDVWEKSFHKIYKSDYKNEWYNEDTLINIFSQIIYLENLQILNDDIINQYLINCYEVSKTLPDHDKLGEINKYLFCKSRCVKSYDTLAIIPPTKKVINEIELLVEIELPEINIIKNIVDKEYSFTELEELFKEDFNARGLEFNGYTLKDYFPEFEKTRKTKNKIKETYYKFKL